MKNKKGCLIQKIKKQINWRRKRIKKAKMMGIMKKKKKSSRKRRKKKKKKTMIVDL